MKVAIIGAGLSGLSCAHELERHGITPIIFEKNGFIGDPYSHTSVLLEMVYRPTRNVLAYLKKNYHLDIKPINTLNNLTHYSPNKKTVIKGNFGYFLNRSREKNSLPCQIHSHLKKSQIYLNEFADYEPLSKEFDYVVIADGSSNYTKELGCWFDTVKTYIRGATVLGDFDPNTLIMWLNKDYCKSGYAYLTPANSKKASIILVVTDVSEKEVDHYWELFLAYENIKYTIVEEYKQAHDAGFVYPHKYENIYFAGNSGGAIDPFLGFGQFSSIAMGVMAARSIVEGTDYEKLIQPVVNTNRHLYQMRKAFSNANNDTYDFIVSSIGMPGIKHLFYYTRFNVIRNGGTVLKLLAKAKENEISKS